MTKVQLSGDEERRREILDAALYCFLHFGYSKTSMDDVAKKAGLSRPLIYLKFKNKEDLLLGLFDHIMNGTLEESEAILNEDLPNKEKLMKIYDLIVIEPWSKISGFPMSPEFFGTCEHCDEKSFSKHEKHKIKLTTAVLGDKLMAEVLVKAIEGQFEDLPSANVLRKRIEVLVDKFVR